MPVKTKLIEANENPIAAAHLPRHSHSWALSLTRSTEPDALTSTIRQSPDDSDCSDNDKLTKSQRMRLA